MAADVGIDCILNIAGNAVPAEMQNSTPDITRAARPIIIANGGNPLIGYAPSNSAKSGFTVGFLLPYANAATVLNAALNTAGVTVALQFGTAGGVSLANAIMSNLEITGSEGGNIQARGTFESASGPTVGATASAGTFGDVYHFSDVTSITLVSGAVYTDLSSFTFRVNRTLIPYRGNSPTGRPKRLGIGHTEVTVLSKYLKINDAEPSAFTPDCPTTGNVTVLLTDVCNGANTLTLVAQSAFYQSYPKTSSQVEAFVEEDIEAVAVTGGYTIS